MRKSALEKKERAEFTLGERMKAYEAAGTYEHLPMTPIVVRLDGRNFGRFTATMQKPFDEGFARMMLDVTTELVKHARPLVGYTASDEITLVFHAPEHDKEVFVGGKHDKLVSMLAAFATGLFNRILPDRKAEEWSNFKPFPIFDARAFTVPHLDEAANCLVWREQDCTRNSIQMAARTHFEHGECEGKNVSELQEMLHTKGINWSHYPTHFKRGTYIRGRGVDRPRTEAELALIPGEFRHRHGAKFILTEEIGPVDMAPWNKLADRVDAYFGVSAKPRIKVGP